MLATLCFNAGSGITLGTALIALYGFPNLRELGGPRTALLVGWFLACVPLASGVFLFRKALLRSPWLLAATRATFALTAIAFACYLFKILRG